MQISTNNSNFAASSVNSASSLLNNASSQISKTQLNKASNEEKLSANEILQKQIEEQAAAQKKQEEVLAQTKGDVISSSDDGDTVRASKKALQALSDGMVFVKSTEPDNETEDKEYNNLSGLTKSQIDQLYQEGKISRYSHDKEVEKREDQEKAEENNKAIENNTRFADDMSKIISVSQQINNDPNLEQFMK